MTMRTADRGADGGGKEDATKVPRGRADRNTEEGVNGRQEKVLTDEAKKILVLRKVLTRELKGELSHPMQEAQKEVLTDDDERDW